MALYLGQTFINEAAPGIPSHLWIVISNPATNERVVIANVSSRPCPSGEVCIIRKGEHASCSRDSYVRFQEVRVAARAQLERLLATGKLKQSRDADHDAPILKRVRRAVAASKAVPLEAVRLLHDQGLGE